MTFIFYKYHGKKDARKVVSIPMGEDHMGCSLQHALQTSSTTKCRSNVSVEKGDILK